MRMMFGRRSCTVLSLLLSQLNNPVEAELADFRIEFHDELPGLFLFIFARDGTADVIGFRLEDR